VPSDQSKRKIRPLGIVALLVILAVCLVTAVNTARNWSATAAARKLKNPVPPSTEALAAGLRLYREHCQKCHGEKGDGRGEKASELSVAPGDFTDAREMARRTDGELFSQISRGRLPMPAFADKLSDEERWQIVDYIRVFAAKPAGSSPAAPLTSLLLALRRLPSCPAPSGCRSF
jgi:mono/diheme cytochrome c family protein